MAGPVGNEKCLASRLFECWCVEQMFLWLNDLKTVKVGHVRAKYTKNSLEVCELV